MENDRVKLCRKIDDGEAIRFRGAQVDEAVGETKELMRESGIDSYFEAVDGEVHGSELKSMILLNQVLGKKNQRTLTYDESWQLGDKFLPKNFYADWGIVVYPNSGANENLRTPLTESIKKRNWQYPIIAHPSSLTFKNGIIRFHDDDSLIIQGEKAVSELGKFNSLGNSGVLGLYRSRDGDSYVYGYELFNSYENGRVPWIRAEGTPHNFEDVLNEINAEYKVHESELKAQEERLKFRKQEAIDAALGILRRKD